MSDLSESQPLGGLIRPYAYADRPAVFGLLGFLPTLYPDGLNWLFSRLNEIDIRKANCWVAQVDQDIVGILIDTPKGRRCHKLSTLYVGNQYRQLHLGSQLYAAALAQWCDSGIERTYVTVTGSRRPMIENFLLERQFKKTANVPDRYGEGRDEFVYTLCLH